MTRRARPTNAPSRSAAPFANTGCLWGSWTKALVGASLVTLAAFGAAPASAATTGTRVCDASVYAGVRHCVHEFSGSVVHVLVVDLSDSRVSFHLALPAHDSGQGFVECASTTSCGSGAYPFETVPHMLGRYAGGGAVAGINTDYFGLSLRPDHGAEGIAVRDGVRLDDAASPAFVGHTSLAVSPSNEVSLIQIGPRSTRLDLAGRHFTVAGGGPQIVAEGRPFNNRSCLADHLHVAVCSRRYETAAGLANAGATLVIAVSRYLDTAGIAAFLVREYSVSAAIKFDGGGSAQMAWLDAAGAVAGFDASPDADGGFRKVAEGLLVFSSPVARPQAGEFVGSIFDEASSAFTYVSRGSDWHAASDTRGIGGSFAWTGNKRYTPSESGRWAVSPSAAGVYQVFVFVPVEHATTRSARYEIRHDGATDVVSVDQRASRGTWVALGAFAFAAGGSEFVRLDDATGEAYATTEVAFDAVGLLRDN